MITDRLRLRQGLVLLSLLAGATAGADDRILNQVDRPDASAIMKIDAYGGRWGALPNAAEHEAKVLRLYESVVEQLLADVKKAPVEKIFIFARDGEGVYDAFRTLIENHPLKKKLLSRVVLFNMSRPIALYSSTPQLLTFIRAQGLDVDRLIAGQHRYVWLDTGNRGSIYLRLFGTLLEEVSPTDPHRAEKIRNIFNGIDAKLIASESAGTRTLLKELLANDRLAELSHHQIIAWLNQNLYFDELLRGQNRTKAGIPSDRYRRYEWVVDHLEHVPHWSGRAYELSSSGDSIKRFETNHTSREEALLSQRRTVAHFSQKSVQKKFLADLKFLIPPKAPRRSGPKWTSVAEKSESTDPLLKPKKFSGLELQSGDQVQMPSGKVITIDAEIASGKRGRVYRAVGSKNEVFALKVAIDSEKETLASFSAESKKAQGLKSGKFRHAKILEHGSDFALKEWIEGVRGDEWLVQWDKSGRPLARDDVKKLWKIFERAAKAETYIGDLNPKNLIWSKNEWVIVDSGDLRYDLEPDEVLERFRENMTRRWGRVNYGAATCLFGKLRELL